MSRKIGGTWRPDVNAPVKAEATPQVSENGRRRTPEFKGEALFTVWNFWGSSMKSVV